MKETLNMGIQIDKELIENNVSNAVCVAIASALGDKDELIGKAVKAVVSSYVDTEGRPCSWAPIAQYHILSIWQNRVLRNLLKTK